jgi:serine/threonine protein kinase
MVKNIALEHFNFRSCNYIGAGQYGRVYKCERSDGKLVALKVVAKENFMEREYETAMTIKGKSPFLIQFYEKKVIDEDVFIIMEFVNSRV